VTVKLLGTVGFYMYITIWHTKQQCGNKVTLFKSTRVYEGGGGGTMINHNGAKKKSWGNTELTRSLLLSPHVRLLGSRVGAVPHTYGVPDTPFLHSIRLFYTEFTSSPVNTSLLCSPSNCTHYGPQIARTLAQTSSAVPEISPGVNTMVRFITGIPSSACQFPVNNGS
jgi:hypothetical protein